MHNEILDLRFHPTEQNDFRIDKECPHSQKGETVRQDIAQAGTFQHDFPGPVHMPVERVCVAGGRPGGQHIVDRNEHRAEQGQDDKKEDKNGDGPRLIATQESNQNTEIGSRYQEAE